MYTCKGYIWIGETRTDPKPRADLSTMYRYVVYQVQVLGQPTERTFCSTCACTGQHFREGIALAKEVKYRDLGK